MTEALEARFDAEPTFLENCKNRDQFFKPDGQSFFLPSNEAQPGRLRYAGSFAHFTEHREPTWPLRKLLSEDSELEDDAEVDAAVRFLRRCLQLNPAERASARELVDDPWLTGKGL